MFKYFSEGGRVAQKRTITQTGVTIRKLFSQFMQLKLWFNVNDRYQLNKP